MKLLKYAAKIDIVLRKVNRYYSAVGIPFGELPFVGVNNRLPFNCNVSEKRRMKAGKSTYQQ